MNKGYLPIYFLCLILLFNCKRKEIYKSTTPSPNILSYADHGYNHTFTAKPLSDSTILLFTNSHKSDLKYITGVTDFYKKRNYEYAWFNKEGISPRISMFTNLYNKGENKVELSTDSLFHLYHSIKEDTSAKRAQDSLLNLELNLTYAFFKFAEREWAGNDEAMLRKMEWFIPKKKVKYEDILDTLLHRKDTSFIPPVYSQYELLRNYLQKYRNIEKQTDWKAIIATKKSYKLKDTSRVISLIRNRLFILGDLPKEDSGKVYDKLLETAVKSFQNRYGMLENGIIGPTMIAQINTSIHKRIEQIVINMERCRWVPADVKGTYLFVNIPEFRLHAYEGNKLQWDMNVVVGKTTNKTVIFNGNLQYVVFNPYWTIPTHLFTKEVLPDIKKDPEGWFKKQDMEVIIPSSPDKPIDPATINWNSKSINNYSVRQKPGKNNALGQVKFLFPNQFNIYLHDTPSKSLFDLPSRPFSHGCIRVGNPLLLAQFLLKNEPGWSAKAIEKSIAQGKEQYVSLKKSVPVFIAYFTTWVDSEGRINFRDDIYGHDARMAKLLLEKPRI